jgi:hypothetical protein
MLENTVNMKVSGFCYDTHFHYYGLPFKIVWSRFIILYARLDVLVHIKNNIIHLPIYLIYENLSTALFVFYIFKRLGTFFTNQKFFRTKLYYWWNRKWASKIILYIFPFIWFISTLFHKPFLHTVSKALAKSINAQYSFFFFRFIICKKWFME